MPENLVVLLVVRCFSQTYYMAWSLIKALTYHYLTIGSIISAAIV